MTELGRYGRDIRVPVFIGYDEIALRTDELVTEVKKNEYDCVAIIMRGGSFVGMHLAFKLNLPAYFLKYERSKKLVTWLGEAPLLGSKILLVEDFAGRGTTLTDSIAFLEPNFLVSTFVVCKDQLSRIKNPTFCCFEILEEGYRFIVPWERDEYEQREKLTR